MTFRKHNPSASDLAMCAAASARIADLAEQGGDIARAARLREEAEIELARLIATPARTFADHRGHLHFARLALEGAIFGDGADPALRLRQLLVLLDRIEEAVIANHAALKEARKAGRTSAPSRRRAA